MIKDILIEQNLHWQGKIYSGVKRKKLTKLIKYLPLKQIITITGIRRCGKSTLLKQAISYLINEGVNPKNILFVNLEHPYFLDFYSNPLIFEKIYEEYIKLIDPKGKIYIFFDEIQYISNWQVYIKSKYELDNIKFIITGSNSSMLSNELNSMLSGRNLNIHLSPFDFEEFLWYKRIEYKSEFDRIKNKIDILRAKEEYLKWGGFYEVFSTNDEEIKKDILISYAKNIIYQDIVPRYKIRNATLLERLFFYLLSQTSNILNYTNISKTFEISDKSLKEYLNYFEDVFLVKRIDKFSTKFKERIKSSKKLYILDNGFLQIYPKYSINSGVALENLVFNHLNNNYKEITYFKKTYEIDFVTNNKLIQVSFNIENEKTLQRELRAFRDFPFEAQKFLVTFNENKKIDDVEVISFDEFVFEYL